MLDLAADTIYTHDLFDRATEIEDSEDDAEEFAELGWILEDLRGEGGDEQWRGDWYPSILIRDSYFEEYACGVAEDIGAIPAEYTWPTSYIDWERAADALKADYSGVDILGVDYWFQ